MGLYAIAHFDEDGNLSFMHSPDVVFLCIDDRAPGDRVYCMDSVISEAEVKALVGSDKIGHLNDASGNTDKVRRILGGAERL